jgi:hypothetical protein
MKGPALLVAATVLALWLGSNVEVGQALAYAAYHAAFVLGPGLVAYAILAPGSRAPLRWLSLGWALGYVLEIAAFMVTAAFGVPDLFAAYPVVVLIAGAIAVRRGRVSLRPEPGDDPAVAGSPAWNWVAAAALCLVFVYVAAGFVTQAPLPAPAGGVTYYADLPFHISLAAEAKNHWPITNPGVSGLEQPYQTFVYMDMAGSSRITGLAVPLVAMRLYFVPLLLALGLQLILAGRTLTRRAYGGPLALVLALLVGELDPDPSVAAPFGDAFWPDIYLSPTFLLGLVFFVPVLLVLFETWDPERPRPLTGRRLLILALLLLGCSGAKGTILPMLGTGLGLVVAWTWLTERRWDRQALTALGAVAAIFVITFFALYHARSTGGSLHPLDTVLAMPVLAAVKSVVPDRFVPEAGFWALFLPLAIAGLFAASWIGIPAALRAGALRDRRLVLLLALAVTSVGVLLLLNVPGDAQLYFVWYGFVAGALLSAAGLARLVDSPNWRRRAYTGVACVAIAIGALNVPLDVFPPVAKRWRDHQPLYDPAGHNGRIGITADLYRGLSWVRDHTGKDDVIAVNMHYGDAGQTDPRLFYFSAFTERRVFLESWAYNVRAYEVGYDRVARLEVNPFPERLRLNDAVFAGSRAAADELRERYGVRYLVVDRLNGGAQDLSAFARPVFRNRAALVYAL